MKRNVLALYALMILVFLIGALSSCTSPKVKENQQANREVASTQQKAMELENTFVGANWVTIGDVISSLNYLGLVDKDGFKYNTKGYRAWAIEFGVLSQKARKAFAANDKKTLANTKKQMLSILDAASKSLHNLLTPDFLNSYDRVRGIWSSAITGVFSSYSNKLKEVRDATNANRFVVASKEAVDAQKDIEDLALSVLGESI